ncbi:MAG: hypothetical protein LBV72_03035 [Tannerella sp.]|jgi:hypothetical protein|nr:hypothetical protein [Tannerella sp.]
MKKQLIYLIVVICCCSCSKKEKLIVGSFDWQQIAIIDKVSGKIEWTYDLLPEEECYDVEVTPQKEVLYAYKQGAKLIKRNHEVVWDYKTKENEELYTATRLESGNYLLAISGLPARIVELDKKGDVLKEMAFNTVTLDITQQFRHIIKTPQNTYLVPLMSKRKISEIDESGRFLRSVFCGGTPNDIKLTDDGKWVVSTGNAQSFIEIDPETKKITRTVETTSLNWGKLQYVAEIVRYKNGNTLLANSNEYKDDQSQPLLVEIDPDNKIVWRLSFNPQITNISTVYSFFE